MQYANVQCRVLARQTPVDMCLLLSVLRYTNICLIKKRNERLKVHALLVEVSIRLSVRATSLISSMINYCDWLKYK